MMVAIFRDATSVGMKVFFVEFFNNDLECCFILHVYYRNISRL